MAHAGQRNLKMIKDNAILYKKYDIDDTNCIIWVNEAVSDLARRYDTALEMKTTEIVVTDINSFFEMPEGVVKILRLEIKKDNIKFDNFLVMPPYHIKIGQTGTFILYYLTTPANSIEMTDIPNIHVLYHDALAKFVASKELSRINKTDPLVGQLMDEFMADTERAHEVLRSMKKTKRVMPKTHIAADY